MTSASRTSERSDAARGAELTTSMGVADGVVAGDVGIPTTTQATVRAVSYRSLLLFYLPLGFSGLMMTLDLPVVNAVLNRLPNPNTSVAALRVAFSLALVYEATHISMI